MDDLDLTHRHIAGTLQLRNVKADGGNVGT